MRRVTLRNEFYSNCLIISIHTLHAEGDHIRALSDIHLVISIHTLHAEGDYSAASDSRRKEISIHTLHAEGDSKNTQNFCSYLLKYTKTHDNK